MGSISVTDAQALYTKKLVAIYADHLPPKSYLRSFFTEVESDTKEISIEVERGFEKVAVDVLRGTEGNRNVFDKSTEKIFVPPYYHEYFDLTQLALYDQLFMGREVSAVVFGRFIESAAAKMKAITDKIDRAYELQASQVLHTGIVELNAGINIDFKRKALSMVDLGVNFYWDDANIDPNTSIELGCDFLRQTGKSEGGVVNMILGSKAFRVFLANTAVQNRGKIFQYGLDKITMAQRQSVGATFHGEISVASYIVRVWSYPEVYTNAAGNNVPYIDANTAILLPEMPKFVLSYAAVPQLLTMGQAPKKGKFLFNEYIDERKTAHISDVKSAGVAIPVAVDQIYTMQVTD